MKQARFVSKVERVNYLCTKCLERSLHSKKSNFIDAISLFSFISWPNRYAD